MTLNQTEYTEKILERFGISDSKPRDSPMITRQVKTKNVNNSLIKAMHKNKIEVPYRETIGSLLYLANVTRPDISFAVNYLTRKQSDPSEEDWSEEYHGGTTTLGLTYRGKSENLEIFVGNTIMWRSHKHPYVNAPAYHTEYFSLKDMLGKTMYPVTLKCE